jgi:hypothetical protein
MPSEAEPILDRLGVERLPAFLDGDAVCVHVDDSGTPFDDRHLLAGLAELVGNGGPARTRADDDHVRDFAW